MRHVRMMPAIALALFLSGAALAAAQGESPAGNVPSAPESRGPEENADRVAVLPFFDYAGSSLKYLSTYIPELIEARISAVGGWGVVSRESVHRETAGAGIDPALVYDRKTGMDIIGKLGASAGISGRYIVEGKSLRIDYRFIDVEKNEVIQGDTYSAVVEDNLLDALDRFASVCADRFATQVMAGRTPVLDIGRVSWLGRAISCVRKSSIGVVFANKWLFSLALFSLFFAASLIAGFLLEVIGKRVASRTATTLDDDIIAVSKRPLRLIIIFIGLKVAFLPLGLSAGASLLANNITTSLIILGAAWLVLQISALLLHSWGGRVATRFDSRIDDDLVPLFVKITKIFILLIAALLVMSKFGIEIGPLIASLGVVGFAVGFAVKDTLSNIIGGIILILDSSFSVGDKVMIDGDTGIVREVGLRNTKLLTYDNEVIVIPNGELMNKKFKNYALPDPKIRVIVKFGVVYGSDADRVERVVLDAISSIQGVECDPAPVVTFEQMGDFSLDFQARFWIPMWSDQYMKKIEATKKIYNALNEAGIGIPFPTHTVYLEKS